MQATLTRAEQDWKKLAPTQFFFEPYADRVAAEFSKEETRLLAHAIIKLESFEDRSRLTNAIMRRWGELDGEEAVSYLMEILEEFESEKNEDIASFRADSLFDLKIDEDAFEERQRARMETGPRELYLKEILIGWARAEPNVVLERIKIELNSRTREVFSFHGRIDSEYQRTLVNVIEMITRTNSEKGRTIFKDRENFRTIDPDPFSSINLGYEQEILDGFFRGLPKGTDWEAVAHFVDAELKLQTEWGFTGFESGVSLLSRWMREEPTQAINWFSSNIVRPDVDPFATEEVISLHDCHSRGIGEAAARWFRNEPERANEWIRKNAQDFEPRFFEGLLIEMYAQKSPAGFSMMLENLNAVQDSSHKGEAVIAFWELLGGLPLDVLFESNPDWVRNFGALETLKSMDLNTDH